MATEPKTARQRHIERIAGRPVEVICLGGRKFTIKFDVIDDPATVKIMEYFRGLADFEVVRDWDGTTIHCDFEKAVSVLAERAEKEKAYPAAFAAMVLNAKNEGLLLLNGTFDNIATNSRKVVVNGAIVFDFMAISLPYLKHGCGTPMGLPPFGKYPDFPTWAKENIHYM